jgi:prepilin-type N-terminal cleavage/methylation domain-containing protein
VKRRASHEGQQGFTLVETMIALAILAIGLGMLLRSTASNVFAAQRAQMLTAAVNLARSKMYDIEETLQVDGFQEMDQSEEGTFSDEGWPQIRWKSEVVKIELPDMTTLQGMTGQAGAEGEEGATGAAAGGGLLGGMLGGGVGGTDPNSAAGAGIMGTYYTMIADVLKEAIRKVTLTVSYDIGGSSEKMVVTCYFTDPGAIARQIPLAGAGGGEGEEGGGAGGQGTGGTGTGTGGTGTGTGGTGTGGTGTRNPTPGPRGGGETR